MKASHRPAAIYFCIQAIAGIAWWVLIANSPTWRAVFWSSETAESVIASFAVADLAVFAGGSAVTAVLAWRGSHRAKPTAWLITGGVLYAWLYCAGQCWMTGEAPGAVVTMLFAVIGSVWAAVRLS